MIRKRARIGKSVGRHRCTLDIKIGLLDAPLPASIIPVKVLPDDWKTFLRNPTGLPVLGFNLEENAVVTEISSFDNEFQPGSYRNFMRVPTDPQRLHFYEKFGANNSGNPMFLILDNQLVLINTTSFGGPGAWTSLLRYKSDINNAMINLFDANYPDMAGSSPTLTEFDMAAIYTPVP